MPWSLAWAKLWPHSLTGFAVIGAVAAASPQQVGWALIAAGSFALSAPFAVATSGQFALLHCEDFDFTEQRANFIIPGAESGVGGVNKFAAIDGAKRL